MPGKVAKHPDSRAHFQLQSELSLHTHSLFFTIQDVNGLAFNPNSEEDKLKKFENLILHFKKHSLDSIPMEESLETPKLDDPPMN